MTKKPKILLVEDEQLLRDIYKETLTEAGYNIDVAAEGDSALEKMSAGGYDLVLLDIMLPNKDGKQIMEALKQTPPQKPNKVVVYMTNLSQDSLINHREELGVSGYIIKSDVTPDEFLEKVHQYITLQS